LVSDAGTPGISDPGNKLIKLAIKQCRNLTIIPVPGPSALAAAASVSGFSTNRFLFLGFPPVKKKRKRFFQEVINSKYPVIFYESPHRIIKSLRDLEKFTQTEIQIDTDREVVVCRELTKKFETIYRGRIGKVIEEIKKNKTKGEFVIVIDSQKKYEKKK
jgi:16S rRNA (cytidine1402-2'-O)-methyltransferase